MLDRIVFSEVRGQKGAVEVLAMKVSAWSSFYASWEQEYILPSQMAHPWDCVWGGAGGWTGQQALWPLCICVCECACIWEPVCRTLCILMEWTAVWLLMSSLVRTHTHTHAHKHTLVSASAVHSPLPSLLQVLWAPLGCHPSLSHTGPIIGLRTALLLPVRRWECPAGCLLFLQSGQWPPSPSPKLTSCSLSCFLIAEHICKHRTFLRCGKAQTFNIKRGNAMAIWKGE